MSKRKNVSWRVLEDPKSSEIINEWLDAQKNIQDSLTNIVLHMIERFGIRNITDYDIQKVLYQESSRSKVEASTVVLPTQEESPVLAEPKKVKEHQGIMIKEPHGVVIKKDKPVNLDDDIYSELDINNL